MVKAPRNNTKSKLQQKSIELIKNSHSLEILSLMAVLVFQTYMKLTITLPVYIHSSSWGFLWVCIETSRKESPWMGSSTRLAYAI